MRRAVKTNGGTVPALLLLIAGYAVFFSVVALVRYRSFSFHDMDLAVINQNFHNLSQGILVSPEYGTPGILSGHKWFIFFPLLPLYLLFPGPPLLLVLQSVALAAGAGAVFLLARKMLSPGLGLAMAFAYLIYPALHFVNLFEFHPIAFATPLLLFAFYFLQQRRWGRYLLFVFLSLSVRQDVAIPVFALGVYALIAARGGPDASFWKRWRWGIVPVVSSLAWFYVCVSLIPRLVAPLEPEKTPEMVEMFFGWLGSTPGEILRTVLTRPGYVVRGVFIRPKITYAWQLLSPVALLPLLNPAGALMVLISMAEGLLSERFTHFSIRYQYSSIITPMVFAAAVLGLKNLLRWLPFRKTAGWAAAAVTAVAVITAWSFGPIPELPRQFEDWRFTREDAVRQAMVNEIPPEAPVTATFAFTPKLSNRPRMFFFYHLYASARRPDWEAHVPVMQEGAEYLLVDFDDRLTFYDFYTPGGDRSIYSFLREGEWELAATVNSLALFRRGGEFVPGLIAFEEPARRWRTAETLPDLEIAAASAVPGEELDFEVLRFSANFRPRRSLPDILMLVRLVSRDAPGRAVQQFLMAPYRIYPSHRWRAGEAVSLTANILVPEDLPPGSWDLQLIGLTRREGLRLPPEAAAAFYRHFDTAMALNYLPRAWGIPPGQLLEQHQILTIPRALKRP